MGYSPWGRKESEMTEQLTHIHTTYVILDNSPLLRLTLYLLKKNKMRI